MSQVVNGNAGLKTAAAATNGTTPKTQTAAAGTSQPAVSVAMVTNGSSDTSAVVSSISAGVSSTGAAAPIPLSAQPLANTKEKTPMCLVNELARFNKIQHQYTLTDEQGPAHKKTFYVKLKLGEEDYASSGPSIKKAQHAAATIALEKTQFKHPPPKPPKSPADSVNLNSSITPTVELNALAMKLGELAIYQPIEPARPAYYPQPNYNFRGMYNQRYHYPKCPRIFYVSLKVGQREFIGDGNTRQAARHNAASKALKVLRNLPLPSQVPPKSAAVKIVDPKTVEANTTASKSSSDSDDDDDDDDEKDSLKSEISLVHEIALKRNLAVNFEVVKESGPPHMRTFITSCSCGEFSTTGEGNSKKLSKKRAAEKMLDEMQKLPALPPTVNKPKKVVGTKKKSRNLIKVTHLEAAPDYGLGINPISRLIQIQQAKKEKEPVYTLVAERGLPRRREFVMQVTVGNNECNGVGPNKKLAKRSAAEAMLQLLGYSRPAPQPSKSAIKSTTNDQPNVQHNSEKKVTFRFMETPTQTETTSSRQLVPGVLFMPSSVRTADFNSNDGNKSNNSGSENSSAPVSPQTTAAIAKELLDTGASPTAEAMSKAATSPPAQTQNTNPNVVRPKQQLLYLAEVLGFPVQFTDFPKGNKSEYLSLVSFGNNPPQVAHGSGQTLDDSHDQAALTALRAMAEVGLDSVAPSTSPDKPSNNTNNTVNGGGDGPSVKKEEVKAAGSDAKLTVAKAETQ